MKIKYFLCFSLFAIVSIPSNSFAQSEKKVKKIIAKSNKQKVAFKFDKANEILSKAIKKYPQNESLIYELCANYIESGKLTKAEPYLRKLYSLQDPPDPKAAYSLYVCYKEQKKYEKARKIMEAFVEQHPYGSKENILGEKELAYLNTVDSLKKASLDITFSNLGKSINTEHAENLPFFSADGRIIFSRIINNQEDIYISKKTAGGFEEAVPLDAVNTEANEGSQCISPDGNFLFFTGCERRDGYGRCDLYVSFRKGDDWSSPKNLGANINTSARETQPCISADGNTLYFVSNRPGGFGKDDIYRSEYNGSSWQKPVNLGPSINTEASEESPYIHPDAKSLYFISNGHRGMGGKDIFYSKKIDDVWQKPENLGYPINQEGNEYGLYVDLNGNKAYYASDSYGDSYGLLDIYSFELPEKYKPDPISFVKVLVRDAETKEIINAIISITDLDTGDNTKTATNAEGEAIRLVNPKSDYNLSVKKLDYVFHSEHVQFKSIAKVYDPIEYEVFLNKIKSDPVETIEAPKAIVLKNIFFESGSYNLLDRSNYEIQTIVDFLKENPSAQIKFLGHTDNVGSDSDNLELSDKRAKAVLNAVQSKGVDVNRLSSQGMGETQAIDTNETDQGRQNNRRTEMIIRYE